MILVDVSLVNQIPEVFGRNLISHLFDRHLQLFVAYLPVLVSIEVVEYVVKVVLLLTVVVT